LQAGLTGFLISTRITTAANNNRLVGLSYIATNPDAHCAVPYRPRAVVRIALLRNVRSPFMLPTTDLRHFRSAWLFTERESLTRIGFDYRVTSATALHFELRAAQMEHSPSDSL